ncbi:MAG: phosphoribosyltransferase [Candidatus Binatia bacterium]
MPEGRFLNRRQAGRLLAESLGAYRRAAATVVLGLPRGGVVPAAEIARILELPLDVLLSRKLRAPGNPELAIGAVAEGGEAYRYESSCEATGASDAWIARETAEQRAEIDRRRRLLRGGAAVHLEPGSTVILVDDGVATGSTAVAAIHALRQQGVGRIVLATAVAPLDTADHLRAEVDELVVLKTPEPFWSVGGFYEDFEQVSDEEVRLLLDEAHQRRPAAASASETGER